MKGIFSRSIIMVVIFALVISLFGATSASAVVAWNDGTISNTYTVNCPSQIFGSPYTEVLTNENIGYGTGIAKVGDTYYGRIMVSTTGNPCAGPYVHVEVALPKNTEFAVDSTHHIECWTQQIGNAGTYQQLTDGSCPTLPSMGIYGTGFYSLDSNPAGSWKGGPWPVASGQMMYIYFPIKSSVPLAGIGGSYTVLAGAIQAIDGYNTWDGPQVGWNGSSAPSSGPYQWVTVTDFTPVISYQATSNITSSSAHVSGTLNHNSAHGDIYIDMGATSGYGYTLGPVAAPNTATTPVSTDFTGLTSGTVYHWRIRYVRVDGTTTPGLDQTFTTTGSAGTPPPTFNLSVTSNSNWHLGYTTTDMGAHYTLTAYIDQPGYYFKDWNIDSGAMTSTSNPYVLTMNSNHNVAVDLGFYEADLAITASGNPAAISPTGQVTYTLTMTNNGALSIYATTTIPDVVVTDTLPPGMAYVSSSWSGGACAEAGGTVTCNLGTVASGASRVITIVAEPSSGLVAKTVTNTATVSSVLIAGNDTVPANNTASVSTTISSFGAGAGASNGTTSSAAKGSTNVPMVQLVTMATGTENMKITKITVQASGSGNDALDITSVKLYLDVNGNGIVDAGDTLLSSGTFTADNGTLDLTLSSALTVTAGTPQNLLVTYDINTTLAKVLPFTGFSLLFLGMIAGKRSRRWMLLLAIGVFMVWFHGCSGGGGGGDAAVTSPTNTTATLASLSVTPANPTLNVGSTQQFTATGMYSDSTTKDLTSSAVWASSNPAVATITATGMATVISAGTTTVTATSAGIANSTVITGNAVVAPAVPTSTYQVSIIGITAKGATSNQPIVLPGLPVMGTTVSVVK